MGRFLKPVAALHPQTRSGEHRCPPPADAEATARRDALTRVCYAHAQRVNLGTNQLSRLRTMRPCADGCGQPKSMLCYQSVSSGSRLLSLTTCATSKSCWRLWREALVPAAVSSYYSPFFPLCSFTTQEPACVARIEAVPGVVPSN